MTSPEFNQYAFHTDRIDAEHAAIDRETATPEPKQSIQDLVIADMIERKNIGMERYGTELYENINGRDMLIEMYEELLDGLIYLKCYMVQHNINP